MYIVKFNKKGGIHLFCTNCGVKCSNEDKFCHQCGTLLKQDIAIDGDSSVQFQSQGQNHQDGTVYIVLGWILFGMSLLFVPILFGAGSVIMGYLVKKRGRETHGTIMMILGVAGGILGCIIGAAVGG